MKIRAKGKDVFGFGEEKTPHFRLKQSAKPA
jgi:hypothetical protein